MSTATGRKTRFGTKPDIPGEIKNLYNSSFRKLKELEEYLNGFNDLAKRAELDSGELYCPKCKKSRDSQNGAKNMNLSMLRNQDDVQEIERLKRENEKIKKEYNAREWEVNDLKKEIEKLRTARENEDLIKQREKIDKERDASKQEIQSLQSKVAHLEDENCRLQRQHTELQKTETLQRKEIKDLQRSKDSVQAELVRCKQENARQQDQIGKLNQEIQLLRQRPRKRVSLYTHTTLNPTLADHALRELMTKLRERLQTERVELEERLYDSRCDVTDPVVAICINVSRLGTDVQEVVKNVKTAQQDIVVLVLHHKETHALPNQSSDRILTGAEYKKLGAIIDVAFLSNKGMYPCELNTFAIERLVSFLLQYKKDT